MWLLNIGNILIMTKELILKFYSILIDLNLSGCVCLTGIVLDSIISESSTLALFWQCPLPKKWVVKGAKVSKIVLSLLAPHVVGAVPIGGQVGSRAVKKDLTRFKGNWN